MAACGKAVLQYCTVHIKKQLNFKGIGRLSGVFTGALAPGPPLGVRKKALPRLPSRIRGLAPQGREGKRGNGKGGRGREGMEIKGGRGREAGNGKGGRGRKGKGKERKGENKGKRRKGGSERRKREGGKGERRGKGREGEKGRIKGKEGKGT